MAELAHQVAHHFDDAEQQREAGALGMWIFLVTEIMFFGGMFTAYVVYRTFFPETFARTPIVDEEAYNYAQPPKETVVV